MSTGKPVKIEDLPDSVSRLAICVTHHESKAVLHDGEDGFREELRRHFSVPEIKAGEGLFELKTRLRMASADDFWQILVEGMTEIAGAQIAFVCKRAPGSDQNYVSDKLQFGATGALYMALAYYYNDGYGKSDSIRNKIYEATFGTPCDYMRYNKVLIIPERFAETVTSTDSDLPFPVEACLAVPLFSEGKCFGHFGMMWSPEGARNRKLPWSSLEFFMYALEDLITARILAGRSLPSKASDIEPSGTSPFRGAAAANQSLKPYARNLSHELRTPMQGVVGMLDVMHATVQEEAEGQPDRQVREVFRSLKENIESVQDSSRRAVEATDNVVHAYDLNMQVPETPKQPTGGIEGEPEQPKNDSDIWLSKGKRPCIVVEGHDLCIERPNKRRRSWAPSDYYYGQQTIHQVADTSDSPPLRKTMSPRSLGLKPAVRESEVMSDTSGGFEDTTTTPAAAPQSDGSEEYPTAAVRHSRLRELLHLIINESLSVGERPDSAIVVDTDLGERIEVRSKDLRGDVKTKVIELAVDPSVPETLLVDERDLTKLISCVFLNALKFTECGKISVTAKVNQKARYIVVTVADTGPGIPQAFLPYLFKPFSREDDSLTRQKDGLGLGLLVAKGLARKIGGDLNCVSSDTSGPNRGSVFEIRMPVTPLDSNMSGPSTPIHRTPTPSSSASRQSPDVEGYASPPRSAPTRDIALSQTTPSRSRQQLSLPTAVGALSITPPMVPEMAQRLLITSSRSQRNALPPQQSTKKMDFDRRLAEKYPITFLVAEDNRINRKLLVNMLGKMGYNDIYEAFDGADAVRQMETERDKDIDVILMDLWMPYMDGYEAARRILSMPKHTKDDGSKNVTILAVTADVTDEALEHAAQVGMEGFMTKPYKLLDLERLILEFCARKTPDDGM